jgi:hypothetical protein
LLRTDLPSCPDRPEKIFRFAARRRFHGAVSVAFP